MIPEISLILPCYRAAPLALRSVERVQEHLSASAYTGWEVIVVDDGGGDFGSIRSRDPRVRLERLPRNMGKGAAVARGMLAARGLVRVYTDVDLPYGTEPIDDATAYIASRGYHVVIGDRQLQGSQYTRELKPQRRVVSAIASMMIGSLVTGGFHDTQCGLKAFRGDIAELVFRAARIHRFAFDIEVIYIALKHKLDIKRIPVQLQNNETSSVRPFRDSMRVVVDLMRIKSYQLRGQYALPALDAIVTEDHRQFAAAHRTVRTLP